MPTLALKYRPTILHDLIGQDATSKALSNTLGRAKKTNNLHQAYLFAGLRGTGKTSTARIFARALNCFEGPTPNPCGVCDACKASRLPDSNLDVIEIDAASRSSVDDARSLREQVQTKPAFCRYRVYIIDEVQMLSKSAFDALLKLLEEPPAHAIFILATTELDKVPDTIKSRVQLFPFRLIPIPLIQSKIENVCALENVTLSSSSARTIAESAEGSMRDALTVLERVIASSDGDHIDENHVRSQLGIVSKKTIEALIVNILAGNSSEVLHLVNQLDEEGSDWQHVWKELVLGLQQVLEESIKNTHGPEVILRWARLIQLFVARERDLKETAYPRVVVELCLVTACNLPYLSPLENISQGSFSSLSRGHSLGSSPEGPKEIPQNPVPNTKDKLLADPNIQTLIKLTGGSIN